VLEGLAICDFPEKYFDACYYQLKLRNNNAEMFIPMSKINELGIILQKYKVPFNIEQAVNVAPF
jgi:RNA polymerase-interacting CarD/CdnL/TRCF family regulator